MSLQKTVNEQDASVVDSQSVDYFSSFNFKGSIFIIFLVIYVIAVAAYAMQQKDRLLNKFKEYQQSQVQETIVIESNLAVLHAMTTLLMITESSNRNEVVQDVHQQFQELSKKYERLNKTYPEYGVAFKSMLQSLASTVTSPTNTNFLNLKVSLQAIQNALGKLLVDNQHRRSELVEKYHAESNRVALLTLFLGLTGLIFLGLVTSLFFHQLTRDIKAAHSRVASIMNGDRTSDLKVERQDELGSLVFGINHMTNTLKLKEQALEVEQRKALYREMMGTIEHLSGGLVHELGNPVAAISGLLNEIDEYSKGEPLPELVKHNLDGIQIYTNRLLQINSDISKLATPISDDLEWVDINQLIDSAVSLTRYDERWYGIDIQTSHGEMLPALQGHPEQLLQAIMNCLSNAVESFENTTGRDPIIKISAAVKGDTLVIDIADNGCGMPRDVQKRAFDAFFTTKAEKSGGGMGLPMTKGVIKNHKGKLLLNSEEGVGTKVSMQFPIHQQP